MIKSGIALCVLLGSFLIIWKMCDLGQYMMILLKKLKVLLAFIFLLWLVLGLFETPEYGMQFIFFRQTFYLAGRELHICFDWYDLYKGFVYALRIYLMIASFYTVLITTNFSDIILGLQKWKVPYGIAFGIGLVFQIIPIIIAELQSIMEAQSSRGLEIDKCGWKEKIHNYVTFSIPLLFRVIGKGQAISLAMHYYHLDFSQRRSTYRVINPSKYDVYFIVFNIFIVFTTITLNRMFYVPV